MTDRIHHTESGCSTAWEPEPNAAFRKAGNLDMDSLLNVELPISISFGSLEMPIQEVLKLNAGSVVELDKSVNDPVTIIVNHRPIARGEVVVIAGHYGVRILEVESTADRIRSLR